jgi:hypothetical protein
MQHGAVKHEIQSRLQQKENPSSAQMECHYLADYHLLHQEEQRQEKA